MIEKPKNINPDSGSNGKYMDHDGFVKNKRPSPSLINKWGVEPWKNIQETLDLDDNSAK